jgi:hypothetical protein
MYSYPVEIILLMNGTTEKQLFTVFKLDQYTKTR